MYRMQIWIGWWVRWWNCVNERSTVPPIIIEVLADLESQTAWLETRMHLYATETIQPGNHGD